MIVKHAETCVMMSLTWKRKIKNDRANKTSFQDVDSSFGANGGIRD